MLIDGKPVLSFASNDYLGLAADPRLARAASDALGRFGWGSGGSQLICGHTSLHGELERALAGFKRTEAALVLPTGYMANLAAIRTLALEIILAPTRAILMPNLQGIRVFADRYRGALLAVGVALLGLWQTALAFFASTRPWSSSSR